VLGKIGDDPTRFVEAASRRPYAGMRLPVPRNLLVGRVELHVAGHVVSGVPKAGPD
jgi:hypothetical protein